MTPILEVRGLRKSFAGHQALRGIEFTVGQGEIISVLGPSGCGKSTLLQLIAGLQQPDEGEVRLRGETVSSATRLVPPEKRRINMVFQDYALWPHMSVYDNIAYGLKRKRAAAADIRAKVAELLELLHLTGLESRLPAQLSGGQQQRVAIARALATEPELLLLDEPLSNLDMKLRIEMRTEMSYLFRKLGTTVFHVTHDPEEAFAMADRLVLMRSGAIDQIDRPQVCYSRPATRSAAALLGAGNRLAGTAATGVIGAAAALRIGEATLRGLAPAGAVELAPGAAAEALFRPEAAVWAEAGRLAADEVAAALNAAAFGRAEAAGIVASAGAAAAAADPAPNRIAVRIVHSSFEGSRWRVLAEAEGGGRLAFFHEGPLANGSAGALVVPATDTYIYPLE